MRNVTPGTWTTVQVKDKTQHPPLALATGNEIKRFGLRSRRNQPGLGHKGECVLATLPKNAQWETESWRRTGYVFCLTPPLGTSCEVRCPRGETPRLKTGGPPISFTPGLFRLFLISFPPWKIHSSLPDLCPSGILFSPSCRPVCQLLCQGRQCWG